MENPTARRPLAYTVEEAAALLRVSPSRIRVMVRSGALPQVAGLGRAVRIPSRALFELVGEPAPPIAEPLTPELTFPAPSDRPSARDPVREPGRVTVSPRFASRPPAPRHEKQTSGPIRAGDQRLWLLFDPAADRVTTWHIGETETMCGKLGSGRWRRSEKRGPRATMCPRCLTESARLAGIEMASIPIDQVCMLREKRHGDSVATVKSGWHLGTGRVTKCGKRDGPWFLTEREPSRARMCFVCDERRRWEREHVRGSLEAESAGRSAWSVLVDATVAAGEVDLLIGRAPGLFAARRTARAINEEDLEGYRAGARELFVRGAPLTTSPPSAPQFAPDLIVSSALHAGADDAGWNAVLTPGDFVQRMRPLVDQTIKAGELRERWDREERSAASSGRTRTKARGRP